MRKDKYGNDVEFGVEEAKYILSLDWRVRSDLALTGEFVENYHMLPEEYIKKYDGRKNI